MSYDERGPSSGLVLWITKGFGEKLSVSREQDCLQRIFLTVYIIGKL